MNIKMFSKRFDLVHNNIFLNPLFLVSKTQRFKLKLRLMYKLLCNIKSWKTFC